MTLPVTILGGYLGAGKTTLLNRILTGAHGQRVGVIVNDFGALNVDARLIVAHDGDTVSLANGCVCCSASDGTGEALAVVGGTGAPACRAHGVPGARPRAKVFFALAAAVH